MIQRIQTVFMLLVVLAGVFLCVVSSDVVVFVENALVVQLASVVVAILAFLSILSYKNRKKQLMLNTINMGINALLIGVLLYWLLNVSGGISFPEKGIEPVFPILAVVCLAIANAYIRRDERLVKSVDRLR